MALQVNGKIIAGGKSFLLTGESQVFSVWRFNSNGSIDSGFGTGGVVTFNNASTPGNEEARSVLVQPDGKIVAAGEIYLGFNTGGFIMRLLPQYYTVAPSVVGNTGGFVDCSPLTVPEGGDSKCVIVPESGNFTKTLNISLGWFAFPVDPVWIYTFTNINVNPTIEAEFAVATIWLFKNDAYQSPPRSTLPTAFTDMASLSSDLIRMKSGAYYNLAGITCSDIGSVVPTLSGGWAFSGVRGTVPTVIATKFTISGTCSLIIDEISIQ
jgi:hypothetical protein